VSEEKRRLEGVSDESEKLKAEHEGLKGEHGVLRREQEKLKGDHDELQGDLEKLKGEHLDLQRRLEEAQSSSATHEATITSLRSELDSRPAESVPSPKPNGVESSSPSHIDESAAQLELSASVERIRALEASLHASSSRVHELSRQLADLHVAHALAQKERDEALRATTSPRGSGSGAKGLFLAPADEATRGSGSGLGGFGGLGGSSPGPSSPRGGNVGNNTNTLGNRSVDAILPAAVRHRRQVSLSALKARMEPAPSLRVSSGRMAAVGEEAEGDGGVEGSTSSAHAYQHAHAHVPKQFGDEIVFCCPACEGDLITL
jgi:hypothetical protein